MHAVVLQPRTMSMSAPLIHCHCCCHCSHLTSRKYSPSSSSSKLKRVVCAFLWRVPLRSMAAPIVSALGASSRDRSDDVVRVIMAAAEGEN